MAKFWKPGGERPRLVDDEEGGVLFYYSASSSSAASSSGFGYGGIEKQRQRLPVYKYKNAILYLVETHATTIIVGETGSGKTTQIPQYLKEAGWADGGRVIACTQPRRLAVQSVASRVAEEMGVKLGDEVGYAIRFEDVTTSGVTMVKFLTDGVLLREMMNDPLLTRYSVIMVDEAHERSLSTDIVLGLLKKIQRRRPELRLIISSATIEAKSMADFFYTSKRRSKQESVELGPKAEPAILSVEGRSFDVEISYVEEPVPDYLRAAVSTVLLINDQEPRGDILVFLTGQDDIDAAVQLLTEETRSDGKKSSELLVLPLYSGLPRADQDLIFSPTPRGKRKVVISTNIAETSLTLEGIVYVVDSGFSKQRFYDPISDIDSLVVTPISKASARQRAGRAGRMRPGKCFRLYTDKTRDFSGGWRMRIALARSLFMNPTILLLDEPTNHLDLEACVWLEETLKKFSRILVVVSHSQDFLNGVCTNIIHMQNKKLKFYTGNFDQYVQTRSELEENQMKQYRWEQEQIASMKEYIARFGHGSAKLARQAQSKEKTLAKMERGGLTEKVARDKILVFRFANVGKLPPPVLQFVNVTFGYTPETLIYKNLDFGVDLDSRVALVGPNGAGKSTLLKLMTGELVPLDGMVRRHNHLRIAQYHQHLAEKLDLNMSALEYMKREYPGNEEERMRAAIGKFGLSGKSQVMPMKHLSDGQKSRVIFAWLAYRQPQMLLLDEPTNHLDIETIDSLADALNEWDGGMVLVSHDFRLINQVAHEIWVCENQTVTRWEGDIIDFKEHLKRKAGLAD